MSDHLFDIVNPELADDAAETFAPPPAAAPSAHDASVDAYNFIKGALPEREERVFVGLCRFLSVYKHAPTSYELFEFMKEEHRAVDLNDVRPRLTGLYQKGHLTRGEKRSCHVTHKSAFTWTPVRKD